jgi:hypothetical protein
LVHRLEGQDGDSVADRPRLRELQWLLVARLAEQALAGPEDYRLDHQAQFVHKVVLEV